MHLERLITILECVGQTGDASVADICRATDLPKPSAYRLVQELVATGLLEPVGKGRFAHGARLRRMTHADNSDATLLEVIAPALKTAANDHGVAFFLSRLRGRSVEIIHVETPETGVSFLHPGLGKRPLHACSCSKAVAAFSREPLLVSELEGRLRAYTEFTVTTLEDLNQDFARIRARGYAECVEEIERGMCSVAAPLDTCGLGATMSIGATGSSRVMTPEFRARIGAVIVGQAAALRDALGWSAATSPDLVERKA